MEKLTSQEENVMQAIWQIKMGAVRDILNQMENQQQPYTTVASIVKNLEQKQYLKARKFGNTNVYTPIISEEDYKSRFMSNFVNQYFERSYKKMVSFFAQEEKISRDELEEIIKLIEKGGKK